MDINLEKYRFGITLDLFPSTYSFGTDTKPPILVCSICEHSVQYFLNEGVTLLPYKFNSWICQAIFDVNIIKAILQAYWDSVGNQCT